MVTKEATELKMPQEFVVDQAYFMVTYEKALYPVVITYIYLGQSLDGEPDDPSDPELFFRYIPAFRYADEDGIWKRTMGLSYSPKSS